MTIRPATLADAPAIAGIYNHYIATHIATFEEAPVTVADIETRMQLVLDAGMPYFVADHDGAIRGYTYANKWMARSAYRFTLESTIYLHPDATGQGLGAQLYDVLFPEIQARGAHCVIAGISLPNAGSVALHERMGMTKVSNFSEVGFKFGQWIDVGHWQRRF